MKIRTRLTMSAVVIAMILEGPRPTAAADDAYRAWENALVVLPGGRNITMREALAAREFEKISPGTVTVIYLHGSTGMTPHDPTQFGKAGFLVIGPDSLKRANRPVNRTGPTGMPTFPEATGYRIEETRYALIQLPTIPHIDMKRLVLFGHSEGGKAAANWNGPEFRAVIMTGWNCHTRDSYYSGLKVPRNTAVMNIVAKKDNEISSELGSSCARYLKDHRVKEVINPDGTAHWMNNIYLPDILRFMRDNTR